MVKKNKTTRIGVFGGTFNPIHYGHLVLAEQAYEKLNLDRVLFIPSFKPPHKSSQNIAEARHRFEMVKIAIKANRRFQLSDIEIKRQGRSYLVDTLRQLSSIYPNAQLFFISGSDTAGQMAKWKSIEEVLSLARFILAKRPGYQLKKYSNKISVISITELDISSSMIRRRIRMGKSVNYLMPPAVIKYIQRNKLYL